MKNWGVDLGGTKIECAVLENLDHEKVLIRKRIATEAAQGYEHIVSQIKKLIDSVASEIGETPEKIGFATPGVLDPGSRTMKNSNTTCLNGKPLGEDLRQSLGVPVSLANDANCFALAEKMMGVARDLRLGRILLQDGKEVLGETHGGVGIGA